MRGEDVRVGVIGLGVMGSQHARRLQGGEIAGARLTAVADVAAERRRVADAWEGVAAFDNAQALLDSGAVEAVVVATPHYQHPPLAVAAFARGLHVLVEKPAGVFTSAVRRMNEAAARAGTVFGIMYNERTDPLFRTMRDMVAAGELGPLRRMSWVVTDWYRPQSYYDSGGWRGTWAGEGGGVLLNQCPHQLDLWQWIMGDMPTRVAAHMRFGRYHRIEVEDDVTAYVEYENGATGTFIASTGEAPGTNRLELVGDRGKLVAEDGRLAFWRLEEPESVFRARFRGQFGQPACTRVDVPIPARTEDKHAAILRDWVRVIREGGTLLAPGTDGIRGLTLSNAMHLSAWRGEPVSLPLDEEAYRQALRERIAASTGPRDLLTGAYLD